MDIAKLEASLAEAKTSAEEAGGEDTTLNEAVATATQALETAKSQEDPIKKELDKVKDKTFTKRERLEFTKKKIEGQLSELDEEEGIKAPIHEDDSTPLTVGMLKKREMEMSKKTALQLAEGIEDDSERELVKHYLENRIKPSGNAEEDVRFARSAVNSLRNAQIAEEVDRQKKGKNAPSSAGNPPKKPEGVFEPTPEEAIFMQPPYNLTKEDIKKQRASGDIIQ